MLNRLLIFESGRRLSMENVQLSSVELVRFNDLMSQTYKKVFSLAYRLSGNRNDAEDLTQEAYYRAYRGFKEYEGDRPFENWIFRIVTRLFLDLMRNRRRRVQAVSYDAPVRTDSDESLSYEIPDQKSSADSRMMTGAVSEDLETALNRLKPEQRLLVMLADVEGMPYQEIADMIGVPVGTVRSRLHRAHKQLRTHLEATRSNSNSIVGRLCPSGT